MPTDLMETSPPDYLAFSSEVFQASRCDRISGAEVTFAKRFPHDLLLIQSAALRPRVLSVEFAEHSHEPRHSASFQAIVSGNYLGMPVQVSASDSQFAASLSVPFTDHSTVGLTGTLSKSSSLVTQFRRATPRLTSVGQISLENSFRQVQSGIEATFFPWQCFGIGAHVSGSFGKARVAGAAFQVRSGKFTFCIALNKNPNFSFGVAGRFEASNATTAGIALEVALPDCESEFRCGFRRSFLMSSVAASLSSRGTVQSLYQRHVKEGILVSVAAFADHMQGFYSVGLGLNITG
jgi:hypothetical protein